GLPIDGMVGGKTKEKLEKSTDYNAEEVRNEMYGINKSTNQQKSAGKGTDKQNEQSGQTKQEDKSAPTATTKVNVPQGFSQNDIKLMANAVHGEARGEPYEGQVAVAAVILNRVESSTFPNTVSGVIFEPRAFTA